MKLFLYVSSQLSELPDADFWLSTTDRPQLTKSAFSFCCPAQTGGLNSTAALIEATDLPASKPCIAFPDFTVLSWPEVSDESFPETMRSIAESAAARPFESRTPKLFWRGASTNDVRNALEALASQHPDRMDVRLMSWAAVTEPNPRPDEPYSLPFTKLTPSQDYVPLERNCDYKYLIHAEGVGYSTRLKYLLACGSPVFVVDGIPSCQEWWQPLLRPFVHYIPVRKDLSDLTLLLQWAVDHPAEASKIGDSGATLMFRVLSPRNIACYASRVIGAYAKSQDFAPRKHPAAVELTHSLFYPPRVP